MTFALGFFCNFFLAQSLNIDTLEMIVSNLITIGWQDIVKDLFTRNLRMVGIGPETQRAGKAWAQPVQLLGG